MNCLDGETLAAWFDGGLSGAALENVQSHVAGCARCQALVGAMGRTRAAVPAPEPERSSRWWLAWAVPAAAAATAVAVWVLVPQPTNVAVTPSATSSLQKQEAQPQSTPPAASSPAEVPAAPPPRLEPELRDRAASAAPSAAKREAADSVGQAPGALNEAIAVQQAPPPATESDRTAAFGRPQARAMAAAGSGLCGGGWPPPPGDMASAITTGSAPSTTVCWIVGRAGTVLRSTDQRTWERLDFPVAVDLTSVNATDAQSAAVVTADGRTFSTSDGGMSWTQR